MTVRTNGARLARNGGKPNEHGNESARNPPKAGSPRLLCLFHSIMCQIKRNIGEPFFFSVGCHGKADGFCFADGLEALILAIVFYRGRHSANIIILAQELHFYEGTFNEFLQLYERTYRRFYTFMRLVAVRIHTFLRELSIKCTSQ